MRTRNIFFAGKYSFIFRFSLGIISIAVLFSSCENSIEPSDNNFHNKILFTSSRDGKEQLYIMNPEGTDIRQITTGEYWHNNGRWSSDAKKIVCNTGDGSTTAGFQIAVMDADGSRRQLLGYGYQMSWHTDGQEILFSYCPSCEIGILGIYLYIINIDGTNKRKLNIEGEGGSPEFSPDGKKIIYTEPDYANNPPNSNVKIISYPDLIVQNVFDSVTISYPRWSPDGKEIVFSRREISSIPNDNIYIMNYDGSNEQRITNNLSSTPYIYPKLSPKGDNIIFLAYTIDGIQKYYLYMMDKDGSNIHRVLDDSTVTSADWSK